jgi:hypothetical protein
MNTQEIQSLENFLEQLVQVRGIAKDPQADGLIASAVAQQPDAAYLLVQRALLLEQALNSAKTQIASLQSQLQASSPASSRGFLDAETWGNTPAGAYRQPASAPLAPTPVQPSPMPLQAAPASPGFFGGGLGATLGTVAATAAGVAGGAFLFQGIENMMHSNSGSGLTNQSGAASFAAPVEDTTINNFYGTDPALATDTSTDNLTPDDTNWDDDSTLV